LPFNIGDAHLITSSELEELAAAFVLESLEIDESKEYRDHLGACEVCRGLLGEFQTVIDVLPIGLEVAPVSDGLKNRILSDARADIESEITEPLIESQIPEPKSSWRNWLTPRAMAFSSSVAVVVAVLVIWNISLQLRLDKQEDIISAQASLVDAIASASSVTQLPGTDAAPRSSGTLILPSSGEDSLLYVRDMPSIPADREFQLWSITDSGAASVGTFQPLPEADWAVVFAFDFSSTDAVGVSIEPIGGSTAPSGEIVLLGTR
jgi:anti-sigma-K factor RskA